LTDEVQYYFPAPFLIDAEGILSYDAHYELAHSLEEFGAKDADVSGTTDGGDVSGSTDGSDRSENSTPDDAAESDEDAIFTGLIYIKIAIDEDWLDQAAYPVTVDPVLKQARVKNLLDYGCVDSDGNLYDTLYVGAKINAKQNINTVYRSFVRFDLPDLPSQSVVTEALLYLGGSAAEGNTHYLQTHMAEKGWYHKAEPGSDEAGNAEAGNTGAESPVPLSWSEQPGRGQLLDYALNAGYFNITKAVRKWADGANNYGIVFSAYDETKNTKDTIRLKNDAAKPYLKVTYRTTTGLESYWSTHTTGAGTAGAGFINDYTGSLTVVNTAVATAGERMPMSISHVYNSTMTGEGAEGWRLNYAQTLRIPLDTVDVAAYPYLYTDADGTEHYFKKKDIYYLLNGLGKETSGSTVGPSSQDEDGLMLYALPVSTSPLNEKYPYKVTDKSSSTVRYFDTFGRLAMITDANQYESGKNSSTKEQNRILIRYESPKGLPSLQAYEDALKTAEEFKALCKQAGITSASEEYLQARERVQAAISVLKTDLYATSSYAVAKNVRSADQTMAALTDASTAPNKNAITTKSASIEEE